ncbi:winged helix-turn-helix transcriptional regulator [Microbacterium sp. Sa4CUA7]|uniref:Winged helix-turn-helix transcriptional regulator n=1 Tax=Microbacterium pullorum TaxID=2762236 RepID=A0ABR8S4X1_9MICO|nr:metalloregulator ArsR/SmtB family transcription factor [Microbacterium pullorum]MBD7958536.1 winged helix-turn-helix transcriptional regulator [Microbacterium pullorum]
MNVFEVLADATRRRILEVLADGEQPAGALVDLIRSEYGISQPAVSQHLRVLRENGFATTHPDGNRRIYALDPAGLAAVDAALARLRAPWAQRLDALHTEVARGKRVRAATTRPTDAAAAPSPTLRRKDVS